MAEAPLGEGVGETGDAGSVHTVDARRGPPATEPSLAAPRAGAGANKMATTSTLHAARTERFTVPLPEGWKAIVARLEYRDATDPAAGPKTTLVAEQRRERGR